MGQPRYVSLLVFERVSKELERVLVDARCSFVAADAHYHFAASEEAPAASAAAAQFAAAVLLSPGANSSSSTIDLGAGRVGATVDTLVDPIQLLHWLVQQPAAADFHPTVNAYLGSSDPDDILPYLPFHPATGEGDEGTSKVVAVRVPLVAYAPGAEVPGRFRIAGFELQLPSETFGA